MGPRSATVSHGRPRVVESGMGADEEGAFAPKGHRTARPHLPGDREQWLVQSACLGDDGALEELCRQEWFAIYRMVARRVDDPDEAEELTQEVFARAIASLSNFRYVGVPFRGYLARIARNLLCDRWRSTRGRSEPATGGPSVELEASDPDPEALVLESDDRRQVLAALARLPGRWREVLYLRIVEGRSASEIAVEWGRSPEAVRQIQHRALVALRAEMARSDRP